MAVPPSKICDPGFYGLEEAIEQAKQYALASPGFEHAVARYMQAQCQLSPIPLAAVLRGLEILGGMLDGVVPETRLLTLLRPFLLSSDPQVASKAALVVGRQWKGMSWIKTAIGKSDGRIRANLVESLWNRKDPEVELVLRQLVRDRNPRVAANAVCGLYLLNSPDWMDWLERLIGSDVPAFRTSGIWVLRKSGAPCALAKLKLLIRDADPCVRHAAFEALIYLRRNGAAKESVLQTPG